MSEIVLVIPVLYSRGRGGPGEVILTSKIRGFSDYERAQAYAAFFDSVTSSGPFAEAGALLGAAIRSEIVLVDVDPDADYHVCTNPRCSEINKPVFGLVSAEPWCGRCQMPLAGRRA